MTSIIATTVRTGDKTGNGRVRFPALIQRLWDGFKLGGKSVALAHDRRRAGEALGAETLRDTGMDPETALGLHTYQEELPFFMQSGFCER